MQNRPPLTAGISEELSETPTSALESMIDEFGPAKVDIVNVLEINGDRFLGMWIPSNMMTVDQIVFAQAYHKSTCLKMEWYVEESTGMGWAFWPHTGIVEVDPE